MITRVAARMTHVFPQRREMVWQVLSRDDGAITRISTVPHVPRLARGRGSLNLLVHREARRSASDLPPEHSRTRWALLAIGADEDVTGERLACRELDFALLRVDGHYFGVEAHAGACACRGVVKNVMELCMLCGCQKRPALSR